MREHRITAKTALANSSTVTVLSASATTLYQAMGSPATDLFFDAWLGIQKLSNVGYMDVYRLLGFVENTAGALSSPNTVEIFHWGLPIADLTYSGYVVALSIDVSGGNFRVRVTGSPSASEAQAIVWLTLRGE